jgi:Holliday junction DNA helicase RuvA
VLSEIEENGIVVDCGGIGYEVAMPLTALERLPGVGEQVKVFTHFQVREDGVGLYGFLFRQDLRMFKQLLGVNGVGPKGALGILSALSPDELRVAVATDDDKMIAKAPGVGTKTAKRIILDLKDKLSLDGLSPDAWSAGVFGGGAGGIGPGPGTADSAGGVSGIVGAGSDAARALVELGYPRAQAVAAVRAVMTEPGLGDEEILKRALKQISFG